MSKITDDELWKRLKVTKLDVALNLMLPEITDVQLLDRAFKSGYIEALRLMIKHAKDGANIDKLFDDMFNQVPQDTLPDDPEKKKYLAIVKPMSGSVASATKGFREAHNPANMTSSFGVVPEAYYRLSITVGEDRNSQGQLEFIKIFLPPGTFNFNSRQFMFLGNPGVSGGGALKMFTPPKTDPRTITQGSVANYDLYGGPIDAHAALFNGEEIYTYTPGAPANFMISVDSDKVNNTLKVGGYVYAHYNYFKDMNPGPVQNHQLQIYVKKAAYDAWYARAAWDADGNPSESVKHV